MNKRNLLLLFLILSLLNLGAQITGNTTLEFITKPFLLTVLSLWFFGSTRTTPTRFSRLILGGLLFSIAGDTLLLFARDGQPQSTLFFLFGLGSFLITHLFYIAAFSALPAGSEGGLKRRPWLAIPFLLFLAGFIIFLWPDLPGPFRLPVAVYSTVIIVMALSCLQYAIFFSRPVFSNLFTGVLLFVLSDSLIALSRFKEASLTIPQSGFLIMATYLVAQYLIARGSVWGNAELAGHTKTPHK